MMDGVNMTGFGERYSNVTFIEYLRRQWKTLEAYHGAFGNRTRRQQTLAPRVLATEFTAYEPLKHIPLDRNI